MGALGAGVGENLRLLHYAVLRHLGTEAEVDFLEGSRLGLNDGVRLLGLVT